MIATWARLGPVLLLCSCQQPPPGPEPPDHAGLPSYETLAGAHNARVGRLERFYADGSIELRWTDEDGKHFAPGQLDLWLEPPDRTAIYISKGGERLMWLGSDGIAAWLFDFRGGETVLHVVQQDERGTSDLPFDPDHLLGLCGLVPLPPAGSVEGADERLDAFVVLAEPADGPQRIYLDRETLLPVRVEILDDGGGVVFFSELKLRRYERVAVVGAAPGSGPRIPTLIDIFSADRDVHAKLSIYAPTDDEREIEARYFDLDWLIESFSPQRIEGMAPVAAAP